MFRTPAARLRSRLTAWRSRTAYSVKEVPFTRAILPLVASTHARAEVVSPTAGIPTPVVEAAVTEPVASYSR